MYDCMERMVLCYFAPLSRYYTALAVFFARAYFVDMIAGSSQLCLQSFDSVAYKLGFHFGLLVKLKLIPLWDLYVLLHRVF